MNSLGHVNKCAISPFAITVWNPLEILQLGQRVQFIKLNI